MKRAQHSFWLVPLACLWAFQASKPDYRDWKVYGGSPRTFAIQARSDHRDNVTRLQVAWTYDTGDAFPGSENAVQSIVIDGVLYATTPKLRVIALDAATGKLLWSFDPNEGKRWWGNRAIADCLPGGAYLRHRAQFPVCRGCADSKLVPVSAMRAAWIYARASAASPRTSPSPTPRRGGVQDLLIMGSIDERVRCRRRRAISAPSTPARKTALDLSHHPAPQRARIRDVAQGRLDLQRRSQQRPA